MHLGHAMFVSLNLMIRYERMRGKAALWILTVRSLRASLRSCRWNACSQRGNKSRGSGTRGISAPHMGWKKLRRRDHQPATAYGRKLGGWLRFTLDETLSKEAVREAFITLWDQGLLYRGPCSDRLGQGCKPPLAILEVEREEETVTLYYFKYMIDGTDEYIPVATIRPETILGDTAVAVHPRTRATSDYRNSGRVFPHMTDRTVPDHMRLRGA
ncbi:MAG: class I tRNA ligase family protein [Anaerolineae bacterium]